MKRKKEPAKRIYLDDYILQKDMRVRMPKEIIKNMNVKRLIYDLHYQIPPFFKIVLLIRNHADVCR